MKDLYDMRTLFESMTLAALANPAPLCITLQMDGKTLLTVYPNGKVEADSIESASEAGRVFVESIRHQLGQMFGVRESKEDHFARSRGDD